MTGNVLKRLREAYGLKPRDVAREAAIQVAKLNAVERLGKSYSLHPNTLARQQGNFRRIVAALRTLRQSMWVAEAERAAACAPRKRVSLRQQAGNGIPPGATHWLGDEPVRFVVMHGQSRGFRWDGDWLRSARVEDAAGKAVAATKTEEAA